MGTYNGGEGNDSITGTSLADRINARGGNDVVNGLAGNDLIYGGAGNDRLLGGDGDDEIYGDSGTNVIAGGKGNDLIYSTSSSDTLDGGDGNDNIQASGDVGLITIQINGGLGNDGIYARGGHVYGDAGDDAISIDSAGECYAYGGDGNDYISVMFRQDPVTSIVDGGAGDDVILLRDIVGGSTQDYQLIFGSMDAVNPLITGGEGNDTLRFEANSDAYRAGKQYLFRSDNIVGFEVIDIWGMINLKIDDGFAGPSSRLKIIGTAAADMMTTQILFDGSEELDGGLDIFTNNNDSSSDIIIGGMSHDYISTFGGDDIITGSRGNDNIDGGDGLDTAIYSGNYANYTITEVAYNTFTIKDNVGTDGTDTIVDVNKLQFADQTVDVIIRGMEIIGDESANSLTGGTHSDYLDGLGGNDTLNGLAGNDLIDGGQGDDRLIGGTGNDILEGGSGADTLYGGDGNDSVLADEGNDTIIGGNGKGNDTYNGGAGVDTVKYTSAAAAITVDLLLGTAKSTVSGDAAMIGTDKLKYIENIIAGNYNDTIKGSNAKNTLNGGLGADMLTGGLGQDLLYGGSDTVRDVFDFNSITESKVGSTLRDKIYNFVTGKDDIDLLSIDANTRSSGDQAFKFGGTTKTANGVWYEKSGADLLVHADINGDKVSDMDIQLVGLSKIVATDFVL